MKITDDSETDDLASALAVGQGAYYLGTGVWPLLHDRSFQAVTGPKEDVWLVKTVGALVGVIGGVLLAAGVRREVPTELRVLAAGSAAALAAVDITYASRGRISPIYLIDAAAEMGLVGAWAAAGRERGLTSPPSPDSGTASGSGRRTRRPPPRRGARSRD